MSWALSYLLPRLAGVRGFKLNPVLRSYLEEHFDERRINPPWAA
jgi:hypothetical protein